LQLVPYSLTGGWGEALVGLYFLKTL
jgi:hypothetical protein